MGNLLNLCTSSRVDERKSIEKRRYEHADPSYIGPKDDDEKPILKAMIGPVGGRGPLSSEQEAGRRRFGM